MSIKAFIFDLDGVITDTAVYHFMAWKKLADELGIAFDEKDNERLKGVSRIRSLEIILEKSDKQYSAAEIDTLADIKNEDYKALIRTITPKDILPGVKQAFAWLKSHEIKIGLASASKNAAVVVEALGMTKDFDYIADAAKIKNSKPAPDVFLDVATALKFSPGQCVGIEDAAAGIEAIKTAGMFAVGIGDAKILNQADLIFSAMSHFDPETVLKNARS
ncbi:MAG: beta-phosphoglucomutase [Myxococcales bacterium]|nr:MAG: beta-phosphoglucomutase [Myxococcales bacterium]